MRPQETGIPSATYPGLGKQPASPPERRSGLRQSILRKEHGLIQHTLGALVEKRILQFEAASRLEPEEKTVIRSGIESIVPCNTAKAAERRSAAATGGSGR